MRRGCSKFYKNASVMMRRGNLTRTGSAIVVGLLLSGCVATTLTPSTGILSPALTSDLSLAPKNAGSLTETAAAENTTDQSSLVTASLTGITVPVRRPGSAQSELPQLALANNGAPSIAAQKAKNIASKDKWKNTGKVEKKRSVEQDVSPVVAAVVATPEQKKQNKSFFASLFSNSKTARPKRSVANNSRANKRAVENRKVAVFRPVKNGALPGVRKLGLFGIYDAKEGADEGYDNAIRLASIGGLARTSPNGLRIQHSGVQVACLQPGLVRIVKKVQRRYGRVPIITSGYRSPNANRRARGARNSMHIYCKAADIQVAGVSKWALAKYLRSIPGRGGVGTYCHTKSVHIDVGSKRDWNWRCRRGKKRRKRKRKG